MKKYIISVLCMLSLLSSMFVLPCSAAGMTVELEHNGTGSVNTVFYMDNDVQFKVIANSVSQCKPEISCTVKNSEGSTIFSESRIHPMSAGETALEVFNVPKLERGKYTADIQVLAAGSGASRISRNFTVARATHLKQNKNSRIGVTTHIAHGNDYNDILDKSCGLGFGWIRDDMAWKECETVKGIVKIPQKYIDTVDRANEDGVKVLLTLAFNNPFYSQNETDIPYTGAALNGYLNYVKEVVTKFKGKVAAYEVWNEPNYTLFNANGATAEQYAGLLKNVYNLVKSIDPDAIVAGPALSGADMTYTDALLAAGAAEYMDVFSIHPYNKMYLPEERLTYDLNKVRTRLDARGYKDKPVWVTEHGYYTSGEDEYSHPGAEQAAWLIRSSVLYDAWCLDTNTDGVYMWYNLKNKGNDINSSEDNFGILTSDYSCKESAYAAAAYNRLTAGMDIQCMSAKETFGNSHKVIEGKYNAKYSDSKGRVINILWRHEGTGSETIPVRGEQVTVYNMYGEIISEQTIEGSQGNITVETGTNPVFVKSGTPYSQYKEEQESGISFVTIYADKKSDDSKENIFVRGQLDGTGEDKKVSIAVLPEDELFSGFGDNFTTDGGGYINQQTVEDGSFAFDFELPDNGRIFTLYLSGTGMSSPYTKSFAVGVRSIAELYIKKNGRYIKNKNEINSGDNINICAAAPAADEGIIIARIDYESGNNKIYVSSRIDADNKEVSIPIKIPQNECVSEIKIFFWDSFEGMQPVTSARSID